MRRFVITAGLALAGLTLVGSIAVMSSAAQDGKQLVQERCTQCHDLIRIERRAGQDEAWWERTVDRMIRKRSGLLNTEEREAVLRFLADK